MSAFGAPACPLYLGELAANPNLVTHGLVPCCKVCGGTVASHPRAATHDELMREIDAMQKKISALEELLKVHLKN